MWGNKKHLHRIYEALRLIPARPKKKKRKKGSDTFKIEMSGRKSNYEEKQLKSHVLWHVFNSSTPVPEADSLRAQASQGCTDRPCAKKMN